MPLYNSLNKNKTNPKEPKSPMLSSLLVQLCKIRTEREVGKSWGGPGRAGAREKGTGWSVGAGQDALSGGKGPGPGRKGVMGEEA